MLVFQTISSSLILPSQISAEGSEQSIFTGISFTDEEGKTIELDEAVEESAVNVHVDWSIDGIDVKEGSTESIILPSELSVSDEQSGTLGDAEADVGTYKITTDGKVTVLINDSVVNNPEANGTFEVAATVVVEDLGDKATEADEKSKGNTEEDVDAAKEDTSKENTTEPDEATDDKADDNSSNDEEKPEDQSVVKDEDKQRTIDTFAELPENIFTFKRLTHNGNDIEDGSIIDISDGTQVEIEFSWNTEGLGVKSGDTASMQLPETFVQVTTPEIPLVTSGITVGTYSIQNGELVFKFNDNIEDGDVSNGIVGLNLNFNLQKFEENIEQLIHFNDSTNREMNVVAKPYNNAEGVTKEGHPDQSHNASEITWTIDVMNNSGEPVSDATLSDILPAGLGSPENFVITELSTGLHGDKITGETVEIPVDVTDNTFDIAFDNLEPYHGYRVQYTTSVDDRDQTEFTNNATFFNGESDLPADATVSKLTASNPVEKSGEYNKETGQIDWTIVANENGFNIGNTIIEDVLPKGLTIDGETFTVEKFVDGSKDENFTLDTNDFPLNLGETAANEHYVINFSTDIDYEQVNDGEYQIDNSFTNVATLNDGKKELAEDDASVKFSRDPLLEKSGTSNVDYENKTLSWTIDVNRAKHPLGNIVITDLIPEGLSISEEDIEITNHDGEDFEAEDIKVTEQDDGKQEVVIDLGDIGTQHITIKYTTGIEDFDVNKFSNTVGIGGDGIGDGDHDTGHEISPRGNGFYKDFKGINYSERTMDWSLKVDPMREAIESLTIEDTFPNKGMILDPSTVVVSHSKNGLLTEGEDFTLKPRTEDGSTGYQKGFIIELNEEFLPLDGGYLVVEYTTSYDPQFEVNGNTLDPHVNSEEEQRVYVNRATYTGTTVNGNEINVNKEAKTTVREDSWNSGKKEGQLVHENSEGNLVNGWQSGSERKIAWQLYTNYQQQNLGSDVQITDTLKYAGTIDEDSIKVSIYDVSADGKTTITDSVLDSAAYNLVVDGDQFTLSFNEEVSDRYVVEFLTTVPDISQEKYTNGATVEVGEKKYPYTGTVSYVKHNHFLDKSTIGQEGSDVYIGDEVNWQVEVNDSLSIIDDAKITDIISAGLEYVQGTLEISTRDGNTLSEGKDYILSNTKTEDGETVLSIEFNETLNQALTLNYTTVVSAEDGDTVNNEVILSGENIENKTVISEELTAEQFSWVDGEFNVNRGALKIVKNDSETGEAIQNNAATFELYYDLNGERVQFGDQFQTGENGEILIGNLPLRTYYLQEVQAPTGYIIDGEVQEIDITEPYGTAEHVYEAEFTNTIKKTDISVTKKWDDANDQDGIRPNSIDVQLTTDSGSVGETVTLSENNNWTHTWSDLAKHHSNGDLINYTVQEVDVPEEYKPTTEVDDSNVIITNTHAPETIEVSVSKVWDDENNQDGVRPNNITVNLLNGSEVVKEAVLNKSNDWKHTFSDLPKFADGEEIQYSVTEDTVENYSPTIETTNTDNGLNSVVTNSYTPEETTATVTKVWKDGNNQDGNRPATISVQLFANGERHGDPVDVTAIDNWTYTWEGLDLKSGGEAINYTVEELNVPEEYEVSVNNKDHGNLVITNSFEPEVTEISVTKAWDDNDNQDGVRPKNVQINLLADGEIDKTAVVDEEGNWEHTFTDLPVYENGEKIKYTITENNVPEYSTSVEEDPEAENGYVVTNTHTPDETSVTVTKSWKDANNQDGNRPTSIEVQLIANGEAQGEKITLTAKDDWTYTWSGLDENADGEQIKYTVKERNVNDEYTVTINDTDHGNIIITNSYTPELTEVPVTKIWDDADNQDGKRPSHIKLHLLNDSGKIVKSVVVQEQDGNKWQYTFKDLPKYENGEEINYAVQEDTVLDYSTTVEKNQEVENGFVVTNSYTPKETSVSVTKGWNDENNQDGIRPESIEVQLTADGEPVGETINLSKDNNWTHTWNGLDLYADGEEIDYSVKEVNVPEGYTSSINNANHGNIIITNTHTPELIDIPVTKVWDDGEDRDRVRPDNVTVNLLKDNGEIVRQAILEVENDWKITFEDLPKYDNGNEIKYRVTEYTVTEYSTSIEADEENEHGFIITNEYTPGETSATVTKAWDDANNQDGIRPDSIEVQLLANGEATGDTVELNVENDWTYTWNGLPLNEAGVAIEYSIDEIEIPEGYEVSINNENHGNLVITNTHEPELTEVAVNKIWDDADNQDGIRPEAITVNLLANGEQVDSETVTAKDSWEYTFTELPKYAAGEEIVYTVDEAAVEGYEKQVDGYNITNSYTPELTELVVSKVWDDANNQDGVRPESVTVNLLNNRGAIIDEATLSEDNEWQHTFPDLPKYENGIEINYSVTENSVTEYSTSIEKTETEEGIESVITNTHTPGETSVTVTKGWDDGNNQDGIRPESVQVQLLADGEAIEGQKPVKLDESTNWTHTWNGLPEKADGVAIDYSVEEIEVPEGYEVTVHDEDHGNIILTNAHTPEAIEIAGTKTWDDANNQDGTRPDSITVNLLANGKTVQSVKVIEADDWKYSFTNLPKYEAGVEIEYTITENTVDGYNTTINGYDITNTLSAVKDVGDKGDLANSPTDSNDKPEAPSKGKSGTTDSETARNKLPDTATNTFNILAFGVGLLIIGMVLAIYRRKRELN